MKSSNNPASGVSPANAPVTGVVRLSGPMVRILLVEDSPVDHLYTRSLLNRMGLGFTLEWVDTYDRAVDAFASGRHDLCLVDYQIEHRSGIELVLEMRAAGTTIPMIILTSRTDRAAEIEALEAGADDYLVKGEFDVRLLERSIRYALERARMMRRLRESQQRYRQIVETAQEGIWMIDADGTTSFVNTRMAEMLGYSVGEMLGRSVEMFFDGNERHLAQQMLIRQRRGEVSEFDFRFRRRDGSSFWAIVAGNPFFDNDGRYIGSLGMITDITARKLAEDELTRANDRLEARVNERTAEISRMVDQLERAYRDQKRFVADASHDFRTPLTVVTAEVDLLLTDPAISPPMRHSLEVIAAQTRRLESLSNDLLVLATLDAKAGRPQMTQCRLDELVFDSTAALSALARDAGISWKIDCAEPIEINCDAGLLRRALTNLLENAIKYSGGPGSVGIRLEREGDSAVIEISDSGIGISEADLPNIFKRFYRGDVARSTPGTGLGLSIVQAAVEAHGGVVEITSKVGVGTSVVLRITDY